MAKAKLTQSELQLALTLVKQSAAAREARRKASPLDRADLAGDPHLRDNRRALEALLTSHAVKSGLDLERFEQINAKNQGDLRRIGEARKAAAVKQSPSTWRPFVREWPAEGRPWNISPTRPRPRRPSRTSCWSRRS
jgi:hypothetical protein